MSTARCKNTPGNMKVYIDRDLICVNPSIGINVLDHLYKNIHTLHIIHTYKFNLYADKFIHTQNIIIYTYSSAIIIFFLQILVKYNIQKLKNH
jgi:hypothetical protein